MSSHSQTSGMAAIIAALLVPSWWLLPQVLAGLGVVSTVSAGCVLWLQQAQPLFAAVALSGVSYQTWLIWQQPPARRTRRAMAIFGASVAVCAVTALVWGGMWLRYR